MKGTLTARYNTGSNVEVLRWDSAAGPNFHPLSINETVTLPLQNPAGATSVALDFRLFDADNNWYWAFDNVQVYTGTAPDLALRAIVDRGTGNVRIVNNTGQDVSLRGYSVRSAAGAFNEANATFLADSNPNWVQLTTPNATSDLSEGHLASANLANGGIINFGDNVWRKFYQDTADTSFQYLVAGNGNPIPGIIEFTGNAGASFPFIDLNFSGGIESGDWDTFRAGFPVSLAGLSEVQRYQLGDLNNDSQHTATDFLLFRNQYNAALGAGSFEALAASLVPEPATATLLLPAAAVVGGLWMRRQRGRLAGAGDRRTGDDAYGGHGRSGPGWCVAVQQQSKQRSSRQSAAGDLWRLDRNVHERHDRRLVGIGLLVPGDGPRYASAGHDQRGRPQRRRSGNQ